MYILVRDRRGHREIPERRRDQANCIERPEPCSRESRRERQPAVELEIEHPAETRRAASAPPGERTVYPIGERRPGEREGPGELRGVAPAIARARERRRGDDRSPEPSAERERVDSIEVIGLPIV